MSASEALWNLCLQHKKSVWDRRLSFHRPFGLVPAAGIEFVDVQHEQNAVHIADSYTS